MRSRGVPGVRTHVLEWEHGPTVSSSSEALQIPLDRPAGRAPYELVLPWPLAGDQPKAAAELSAGLSRGDKWHTLKGVTGPGKPVTMAPVTPPSRPPPPPPSPP